MMLGLHGRPTRTYDVFAYYLATQLGCTVGDIEQMPHPEYLGWVAYYTAKNAIENKRKVG